jgi:phosphopantothenoylcysteine decarboxylase/phosphopantothenate--cysteine ligase
VLAGKRVVLGVSGSIAAYKAVMVASQLVQAGAVVDVVMTPAATELIRPLSFQAISHRPVSVEMFSMLAETEIGHVSLGKAADLILVAPATANTLAKLANGLADDMLSTTVLASTAPLVIAPAMDVDMYEHVAVQENVERLRARGAWIIEPGVGRMASGLIGRGRLAEPDTIVETVRRVLARTGDLAGLRIVVTAGGTREAIDPVRFISNHSSGKMGYAVARAARDRGADVTLISTVDGLAIPEGVARVGVDSAASMHRAVADALVGADVLVMAAAVADYRPASVAAQKIKKSGAAVKIELEPTTDILAATVGVGESGLIRVGFAAETNDMLENARSKLDRKGLHLIVANDVTEEGSGFGTDTNRVVLLHRDGRREDLPLLSKLDVAHEILTRALRYRAGTG